MQEINFQKTILFILLIATCSTFIFGHKVKFKKYEFKSRINWVDKPSDTIIHFSFDIPKTWATDIAEGSTFFCSGPTKKAERKICANLLIDDEDNGGVVFCVHGYNFNLDSTLKSLKVYKKVDDQYFTFGQMEDTIKTEKIKGENWTGLHHVNKLGDYVNGVFGEREYVYFSNGKITVCVESIFRRIDKTVLTQIINSFKFI